MDEDTLDVAYREWRGEPRGKLKKADEDAQSCRVTASTAWPA